jgi:hypothetical protein
MTRIDSARIDNAWKYPMELARRKGLVFESQSLIYSGHWFLDALDFIRSLFRYDHGVDLRASEQTFTLKVYEIFIENLKYINSTVRNTDTIRAEYKKLNPMPVL